MGQPRIRDERMISVLAPSLRRLSYYMHLDFAFKVCGCRMTDTHEDTFASDTAAPLAKMTRHPVFTATPETGTYNHHQQLVKGRGRYIFGWSNGLVNEEFPGQRVLLATSADGESWSEPTPLVKGDEDEGAVCSIVGMHSSEERLVVFCRTEWDLAHAKNPGMSGHDIHSTPSKIDLYYTTDGENWQTKPFTEEPLMLFEGPRLTAGGRLLMPISLSQAPGVCLWENADPLAKRRIVMLPYEGGFGEDYWSGKQAGIFPYGEASWYQTDDGRIWLYHRDESASGYVRIALSEDDGETWTAPMLSDMPDSMSRVCAGRLPDGRYYLIGNSVRQLMDRVHLMLSISDDGATFTRMVQLVAEPTRQRFPGALKADGYQYPIGLADGDKLLIGYSVNKEDIECGIINCADL